MNAGLEELSVRLKVCARWLTYALQVAVDAVQTVHVFQASGGVEQLVRGEERSSAFKNPLTSFDLVALGKRARYSLKLPYSARSEMIESGEMDVSTPRRGRTFGWVKFFQVIISLYVSWWKHERKRRDRIQAFRVTSWDPPGEPVRPDDIDLTVTISPSSVPRRTSAPPTQIVDWWSMTRSPTDKHLEGNFLRTAQMGGRATKHSLRRAGGQSGELDAYFVSVLSTKVKEYHSPYPTSLQQKARILCRYLLLLCCE